MEKKRVLVAIDKFKGSLTSLEAARAVCRGFESSGTGECEFRIVEIADGGDGSLDVLEKRLENVERIAVKVHNPVGELVDSEILVYYRPDNWGIDVSNGRESGSPSGKENSGCDSRVCAFIEMAKVSGLEMLSKAQRNPLRTSTYGLGEAIKAALCRGAGTITLSIGGSATNDGGAGMLQALGYRFYDIAGSLMEAPVCGGDLHRIARMERPLDTAATGGEEARETFTDLSQVCFKVICDVTNPLLGESGATAVYGPQKGADEEALKILEAGLANYAEVAHRCLGVAGGCKEYPGAGAAGGVGYAGLAFLGAELLPGWRFFAQVTGLEESVKWADVVVTGEGSLDSQSLSGKVVSGVLELAAGCDKEVLILCGVSKLAQDELRAALCRDLSGEMLCKCINWAQRVRCCSIASLGHPLEVCMAKASELLEQLARSEAQLS